MYMRMLCAARAHTIGHASGDNAAVGRLLSTHPNAVGSTDGGVEIRRKRLHLPANVRRGAVLCTGPSCGLGELLLRDLCF